ncbi:hypothetical protein ES319_D03G046400v1 [Gossypium barbadense]|uniref:Uncharacterized protein n=3 Tax=Gossypium TaxID=3633 RepID=A0A5J5S0B8_GOSBA|nr:hypothetical protein ES319_D03G046400v1 [Gossypium barbadense]TYG75679.1 hypothetical protein ES288_D03G051600v1 [Gossypium darwinii]
MSGNSLIVLNQPIMGNPATPYTPNQPVEALGSPNMCQPMLHGIMDQQQGLGRLRSSSTQQPVRENLITPSIPNQQLGALAGGSFLNQSLLGNGNMTSNVHFEPQ